MFERSLRIAHVASYGNPQPGSFIPAIMRLGRTLASRGDAGAFIVPQTPNATWHAQAAQAFSSFTLARSHTDVYRALRYFGPDIVHVHFVDYTLEATIAAYLERARIFWHVHSAMPQEFTLYRRFRQKIKYAVLGNGVHRFVAVSDALRGDLERWGVPPKKIAVVSNAVDTTRFRRPSDAEREAARAALGVAPHERAVLFFGRDTHVKGCDILWRALEFDLSVVLLAVGADARALAEFSRRTRVISVPNAPDTVPLYWAADTLVAPSRREGAPLVILEALCCGLPVVASDIPAMTEIARRSRGMTVVPNTPDDIARALRVRTVIDCDAVAREARQHYDLGRWVREVLGVYAR